MYLPDIFAGGGIGAQLNNYLTNAILATYLNRSMVLLEAPIETRHADLQRVKADIAKVFGAEGGIEVLVQLVPTLRKF